jgi:hypothetical protein
VLPSALRSPLGDADPDLPGVSAEAGLEDRRPLHIGGET